MGRKDTESSKNYVMSYVRIRQKEEIVAMHIENVVISELRKSGKTEIKDLNYDFTYFQMPVVKKSSSLTIKGLVESYDIGVEIHVVDIYPISEGYYDSNTFDIKEEVKREGLKSVSYFDRIKKSY